MRYIKSNAIKKTGRAGVEKSEWMISGKSCKGSFTVESVFLFPVIILLIAFLLHLSMDCFVSVRQAAVDVDVLRQMDSRAYFLNQNTLQEIIKLLQ